MKTIGVARKYMVGREVFEVPIIPLKTGTGRRPRAPKGGWSAFYTDDRCIVVASRTAASYLSKRNYARYLGVTVYDPAGIGGKLSHKLPDGFFEGLAE